MKLGEIQVKYQNYVFAFAVCFYIFVFLFSCFAVWSCLEFGTLCLCSSSLKRWSVVTLVAWWWCVKSETGTSRFALDHGLRDPIAPGWMLKLWHTDPHLLKVSKKGDIERTLLPSTDPNFQWSGVAKKGRCDWIHCKGSETTHCWTDLNRANLKLLEDAVLLLRSIALVCVQKRPRGPMVCWSYHLQQSWKSQEEVDWHELRQVGVSILWQGCHGGKVPFLKFQLITCGWVGCENQLLWIPSYFGKWILRIKSSFLNFDDKAHLLHEFKDWHLLAVRTMTPPACHAQSEAEWLQHIQNQYFSRQDLQIGR